MTGPIRLGLVGIGKIARDQHIPALRSNAQFDLVAGASRHAVLDDVPCYPSIGQMIAGEHSLHAVSLCTPPKGRFELARQAISAGLHVMIEKPPGASVSEVLELADLAKQSGTTLFATWHSREAAGVDAAREWLSDKKIRSARIVWREDIRTWHPGQDWILAAGGLGVFDPGINALSIATYILPCALSVAAAELGIPEGREAPLTAHLEMRHDDACIHAEFDFLNAEEQLWDIVIETDGGLLELREGGKRRSINGVAQLDTSPDEYPRLYNRFAEMIALGVSEVDVAPLQLVADAFLLGSRKALPGFDWVQMAKLKSAN